MKKYELYTKVVWLQEVYMHQICNIYSLGLLLDREISKQLSQTMT
jgi:hypothetical protein